MLIVIYNRLIDVIWRNFAILSLWKLYDEKGIVKKHIANNIRGIYVNLKIASCDMLDWLLRVLRSNRIMCFNYLNDPYSCVYGFSLRAIEQLLHGDLQEARTIRIIAWLVIDLLHNILNYRKAVTWTMLEIWPYWLRKCKL